MKKVTIFVVALLVLGFAAYLASRGGTASDPSREGAEAAYSSRAYGISFRYPSSYFVEETDVDANHHEITLIEDTDFNHRLLEGKVPAAERPTSITVDIVKNGAEKLDAREFITETSYSNFKLIRGSIATSTRGGLTGLEYDWSGLYEGKSFVVARPSYVYMFSVTRLSPDDKIAADFDEMLKTIALTDK